jgi:hypothetical protein
MKANVKEDTTKEKKNRLTFLLPGRLHHLLKLLTHLCDQGSLNANDDVSGSRKTTTNNNKQQQKLHNEQYPFQVSPHSFLYP